MSFLNILRGTDWSFEVYLKNLFIENSCYFRVVLTLYNGRVPFLWDTSEISKSSFWAKISGSASQHFFRRYHSKKILISLEGDWGEKRLRNSLTIQESASMILERNFEKREEILWEKFLPKNKIFLFFSSSRNSLVWEIFQIN